jgi:glycosyltransferase involved in cell wall biosynthesis
MVILGAEEGSPEATYIEGLARETGARNLVLRPRVPVAEVATYLYAADCLIVPPTDEPLRVGRTVLPMKIFSYLAAGRPILAPRLPDMQEVLTDGVTACLVDPGDFGGAAAALVALQGDPARRARLARNARDAAAECTWEARARRVLEFLGKI